MKSLLLTIATVMLVVMKGYGKDVAHRTDEAKDVLPQINVSTDTLATSAKHEFDQFAYAKIGYLLPTMVSLAEPPFDYDTNPGVDITFGYDRVYRKGLGWGFLLEGDVSSYNFNGNTKYLMSCYIAPQAVMMLGFARTKFFLFMRVGIGYIINKHHEYTSYGIGKNGQVGFEYCLTKKFGISLNMGYQLAQFFNTPDYRKEFDEGPGSIVRLYYGVGVDWHF